MNDDTIQVHWRGHTVYVRELLIRDREKIRRLKEALNGRIPAEEDLQVYNYLTAVVLIERGDEKIWKRPAPNATVDELVEGFTAWGGLKTSFVDRLALALYPDERDEDEETAAKN